MRAFSVMRAFSGGLIRMVSSMRAMMIVAVLLPRCLARDQCLRAGTGARRAQCADVDSATFSGGFTHTDYHDVPPAGFEYQRRAGRDVGCFQLYHPSLIPIS